MKRSRPPALAEWSIPGGLVHVGETLKAAVAREALEETGLTVHVVALVELLERIFPEEDGRIRYHYVLADFLCEPLRGELNAGSDAAEAIWATLSNLNDLNVADITCRIIEQAFKTHRGSAYA